MGILKFLVLVVMVTCVSIPGRAQQPGAQQSSFSGPKRQMATIIFAGLGGAVLGLSTLSFYGRPQDNLANIAIGFGVGVMTGTVIMTYRAATNPKEFYSEGTPPAQLLPLWERELIQSESSSGTRVSLAQWNLSF